MLEWDLETIHYVSLHLFPDTHFNWWSYPITYSLCIWESCNI